MRTTQLGPCPSHSQRNWAVLTRLRCEQTIVAQPRVTPAGGVPRRGSQVQKKKKPLSYAYLSSSQLRLPLISATLTSQLRSPLSYAHLSATLTSQLHLPLSYAYLSATLTSQLHSPLSYVYLSARLTSQLR